MRFEFPRPNEPIAEGDSKPMARSWLRWLRDFVVQFQAHVADTVAHFTAAARAQFVELVGGANTALHFHSADRNSANFTGTNWTDLTDSGSTSLHKHDHGALDGLPNDTHSQYALLAGRSGGQILTGGTASGNDFKVRSTSHATKGKVIIGDAGTTVVDDTNGYFGAGTATPAYPLDVAGTVRTTGDVILPKTSGKGIKVDTASPTFAWFDLLGTIHVRGVAATDPSWAVYRGGLRQFQFSVNDEIWNEFHLPHDYLPGSDIYIHAHWSHVATTVTGGSVTWGFEASYAKGHNQAAFSTPITTTIAQNASTTRYQHLIAEVQLSAASPSASQIDSDDLEVDGVILVRTYLSANAITVSSGGTPEPYLHYIDIHYQTTNIGTKNKAPGFYT